MNQEAKTAAYFQAHGFLVKRDLKISVESTIVDATDIDVLAIRFSDPLKEERIVVDCKDKRKSKPFERILWTSGLQKACAASRAVVVLPHAPWQAFSFSQNQQVELLKEESISKFLESEKHFLPFGDAVQSTYELEVRFKNELLEDDKHLSKDCLRIRTMLIQGHPLTNFNAIVNILSRLNDKPARSSYAFSWFYRMVVFNAATTAAVMLLRFVAEVKWLDEKDWRDYAQKKLTYGDMPVQKAMSLARTAFGEKFFDGLPAPEYCSEVIEYIGSLINARTVSDLPVVVDGYLFGGLLNGKDLSSSLDRQKLLQAKQLFSVLSYASGIDSSFWSKPLPPQLSSREGLKTVSYDSKKQYGKQEIEKSNHLQTRERAPGIVQSNALGERKSQKLSGSEGGSSTISPGQAGEPDGLKGGEIKQTSQENLKPLSAPLAPLPAKQALESEE